MSPTHYKEKYSLNFPSILNKNINNTLFFGPHFAKVNVKRNVKDPRYFCAQKRITSLRFSHSIALRT